MRNAQTGQGSAARDRPHFLGVFSDEDRSDARKIERGLDIDGFDPGRAMRAAHDAGVVHARHLDVVHIGGGAGDEARDPRGGGCACQPEARFSWWWLP